MIEFAPQADPLLALRRVVPLGRVHRDVLRDAGTIHRMIRAHAVREQRVEDQQVAGFHRHVDDSQAGRVGVHRVAIGRLGLHPLVEAPEQFRHTLEAADVTVLRCEAQHALDANRQRSARGVHVPVDEAVRIALHLLRQIEVRPVDRDPQVLTIPDVDEGVVDARFRTRVPQVLVVVDLEHAGVIQLEHRVVAALRCVPGRGIVRGLLVELPEQIHEASDLVCGHGALDDDVALRGPVLPVGVRQDTQRQLLADVPQLRRHDPGGRVAVLVHRDRLHGYASNPVTTLPLTSVRRKSRPWNLYVSFSWSTPSRCSIVAWRSCTSTGSFVTL